MTKPHIKTLKCFNQVARVIGESNAQLELWKVVHSDCCFRDVPEIIYAFGWCDTPQSDDFWACISNKKNPYLESGR